MDSQAAISREIFKAFKSRGLSLKADASKALMSILLREEDVSKCLSFILSEIKDRIEKKEIKDAMIDLETISSVVADLSSTDEDLSKESTQLFDAFASPKLEFDERQKTYKMVPNPVYSLHAPAESKAKMFRDRLLLVQQRLLRSGNFTVKGMSGKGTDDGKLEISTVDSLLGVSATRVLVGFLTQSKDGFWCLEDLGAIVELDLSKMERLETVSARLYTQGCIVIVQGQMIDGRFQVKNMVMPPAEDRDSALVTMGILDPFGNGARQQQIAAMQELEAHAHESMLVVMSDVLVDKPHVLEKLQSVFEGYERYGVDPLFILMGAFTSKPYLSAGAREGIQAAFSSLADSICTCPRLAKNARFLLVPGPEDPGIGSILPRRPIPALFLKDLQKRVPHMTVASNPCRLRFYTQEIVLFREDLLRKMQRHVVKSTETEQDTTEILAQTILEQEHLCPLPLESRPIYWELDYTLRLSPLPHLLVLADRVDQYSYCYKDCNVVNPGSFSSDFSFIAYRPSTRAVEFSRVEG